jgi:hypothetical protein
MTLTSSRQSLLAKLDIDLDTVSSETFPHYSAVKCYLAVEYDLPTDDDSGNMTPCIEILYHLYMVGDIEKIRLVLEEIPVLTNYIDNIPGLKTYLTEQSQNIGGI